MSSLEVAEDLDFHRKMWRIEHAGWGVLVAFLLAAALGLFGGGPLSRRVAVPPDGSFSVEYQRFARIASPLRIRVEPAGRPGEGPIRVVLRGDYADGIDVERITPQPQEVELRAEEVLFLFGWDGSADPPAITFGLEARGPGLLRGELALGGEGVELWQLVYP